MKAVFVTLQEDNLGDMFLEVPTERIRLLTTAASCHGTKMRVATESKATKICFSGGLD
jgi:hypothetical protein